MSTEIYTAQNQKAQGTKTQESDGPAGFARIKELVQRHRVCWEVYPERACVGQEMRNIGFSLELYGTQQPGTEDLSPGSIHCIDVQSALSAIAKWILPREQRPSRYEVTIDTQSISYSRQRAERPDIRATIQILHQGEWDQPVDACEVRCLSDMEHALSELGACSGAWKVGP